jgi:hypothetical protein
LLVKLFTYLKRLNFLLMIFTSPIEKPIPLFREMQYNY